MYVSDVIRRAVLLQFPDSKPDPSDYGLFLRPKGASPSFLYRKCLISHYARHLCQDGQLELRPRLTRTLRVIYLKYITSVECGLSQTVASVIALVHKKFSSAVQLPQSKNWSFVHLGAVVPENAPMSEVFNPDGPGIPSVIMRLEFAPGSADPSAPLFKGSLQNAVARAGTDGVPEWFMALLNRVLAKKELEGIYRKSGLQTSIDAIIEFITNTKDGSAVAAFVENQAGHDVACVVKQYIRSLTPSVVPVEFSNDFKEVLTVANVRHSIQLLKILVTCLPTAHYELLKAFCVHAEEIIRAENQMGLSNIALVLGGNFFRTVEQGAAVINETTLFQNLASLIFQHWRFIFLNEPLVVNDRYVITKRDVPLPKCVVPAGHRMKFIDNISETEVKLEYSGLPTTLALEDVEFVDDDDQPPVFWKIIGEAQNETWFAQLLEPGEVPEKSLDKLKAAVRADQRLVDAAETEIKGLEAIADAEEKATTVKRLLQVLAQF
jgi:hypothetical protein